MALISDFYDPAGARAALELVRRNRLEAIAVQISAPDELAPQLRGDLQLCDVETGEVRDLTVSPRALADYAQTARGAAARPRRLLPRARHPLLHPRARTSRSTPSCCGCSGPAGSSAEGRAMELPRPRPGHRRRVGRALDHGGRRHRRGRRRGHHRALSAAAAPSPGGGGVRAALAGRRGRRPRRPPHAPAAALAVAGAGARPVRGDPAGRRRADRQRGTLAAGRVRPGRAQRGRADRSLGVDVGDRRSRIAPGRCPTTCR